MLNKHYQSREDQEMNCSFEDERRCRNYFLKKNKQQTKTNSRQMQKINTKRNKENILEKDINQVYVSDQQIKFNTQRLNNTQGGVMIDLTCFKNSLNFYNQSKSKKSLSDRNSIKIKRKKKAIPSIQDVIKNIETIFVKIKTPAQYHEQIGILYENFGYMKKLFHSQFKQKLYNKILFYQSQLINYKIVIKQLQQRNSMQISLISMVTDKAKLQTKIHKLQQELNKEKYKLVMIQKQNKKLQDKKVSLLQKQQRMNLQQAQLIKKKLQLQKKNIKLRVLINSKQYIRKSNSYNFVN